MIKTNPELRVSKSFLDSYHRASPVVQNMAEGSIRDFVRRFRSDPRTAIHVYQRLPKLKKCQYIGGAPLDIREIEIGSKQRMVGYWSSPCLTLLELGGHELIPSLTCKQAKAWIEEESETIPAQFMPDSPPSIFVRKQSEKWVTHPAELSSDWIYYLDDEQKDVVDSIYENAVDVLLEEGYYQVHTVIGGPGTGKTSILLNLLKRFSESLDGRIGFIVSNAVRKYLEAATSMELDQYRFKRSTDINYDVLLYDDPSGIQALEEISDLGKRGCAKVVVLAFDPLQLDGSLSDKRYEAFVSEHKANEHVLRKCYRQKKRVGEATKRIMDTLAESTPFLDTGKQQQHWALHAKLTQLCNDLVFVNPSGYTEVYDTPELQDLKSELESIKSQKGGMWVHFPPLLVTLLDRPKESLPAQWRKVLDLSRINYTLAGAEDLGNVKGVEFQHVFVLLSQSLYIQLNSGFTGSGQKEYNSRRLIRIPFSRAKDRLVVFVLD